MLHSGLAAAIGHQREYDPAFHFMGGAAGAYSFLRALNVFRADLSPLSRRNPVLIVLAAVFAVTVAWEVIEFISDQLLGSHVQLGTDDTAMDILLGVLGALCMLALAALVGRRPGISGNNAV